MEVTGGQMPATIAANLKTWMAAVQAGTGKVPMIYTAEGYWDADVASTAFAANPLWVANWGVTCPSLPTGWSNWEFWQDADNGSVAGISGAVDTDEFNGSLAQLQSFAGGGTASDGGVAGVYAATYVTQSWPLASTTMTMTTCQTVAASITFKNSGTLPWDGSTRLGTTQPRDRASAFGDSTWISDNRAAQVSGTIPPGGTFEFKFDFHAPPTAGSYKEYFGLVQDGVAWFSDPGQGGPPDNDIEANIQVTAGPTNCTVDQGVPDGGGSTEGGTTTDGGAMADSGSTGGDSGVTGTPGDAATEPGSDAGWAAPAAGKSGGCGCDTAGSRGTWAGAALGMALVLGVSARRRRRKTWTRSTI
jgi:MYXO-CTERM domain-containing protein